MLAENIENLWKDQGNNCAEFVMPFPVKVSHFICHVPEIKKRPSKDKEWFCKACQYTRK